VSLAAVPRTAAAAPGEGCGDRCPVDHWEALLDLAGVLRAAGEPEDAAAAAREALALYERKENVVEAARASAFLAELER